MAPHSSTLSWKISWMEEPGGLQPMGSRRVGHDWVTSLSLFTLMHWRRKWQPTQCSCLENPRDRGAWWAAVYGFAQSRTQLKQLSSSSSMVYNYYSIVVCPDCKLLKIKIRLYVFVSKTSNTLIDTLLLLKYIVSEYLILLYG